MVVIVVLTVVRKFVIPQLARELVPIELPLLSAITQLYITPFHQKTFNLFRVLSMSLSDTPPPPPPPPPPQLVLIEKEVLP